MKKIFIILSVLISINAFSQTDIAFRDDFNENTYAWSEKSSEDYETKVENGYYNIFHKRESGSWFFWNSIVVNPDKDFVIESKIKQESGVDDNGYGIIWGTSGTNNAYIFAISSNGYFKVAKYEEGNYENIQKWKEISNINGIGTDNILKIKREGKTLYFYVNDEEVYKTKFQPFFGGLFGFILHDKMKINIDYLEIRQDGMKLNLVDNPINGYVKENLGKNINSEYSEIDALISQDGRTLYVTRKDHPGNIGGKNDDIWVSTLDDEGNWKELENFGKPLNNSGNNSIISVSPDGNTFLVMNHYSYDGSSNIGSGISLTNRVSYGLQVPHKIEIKNYVNESDYAEYCLAPNKKALVMAIKTKDSYGGRDLYVSFDKKGEFTEPMNLGPDINSFGDEISPFLASDNKTLYFSSDGRPGYGNNDIFVSKRLDDTWKKWSEPKNLGPEINSSDWDAYYTIPASGDYAFLTSSNNSIGKSDIFKIKQPEDAKPDPVVLIYGKVLNAKTNEPMDANIAYNDLKTDEEMGTASSDPTNGEYKIVLPYGTIYSFRAAKQEFYPVSDNINVSNITEYAEIERNLYLSPIEVGQTIRLNNIFFDNNESTLKEESFAELNRLVELLKENKKMKISLGGHTDNVGSDAYNLKLSDDRVNSVIKYVTENGIDASRLSGKGYGETKPIATNDTDEGKALNRRVEFTIEEMN